jgi:tetratricopeptide (TPR) repeat protein
MKKLRDKTKLVLNQSFSYSRTFHASIMAASIFAVNTFSFPALAQNEFRNGDRAVRKEKKLEKKREKGKIDSYQMQRSPKNLAKRPVEDRATVEAMIAGGEIRRGTRISKRMLRFEPRSAEWNALLARFLLHSGKADSRTEFALKAALHSKPGDSSIVSLLAMAKLLEGNFPLAKDLSKAALKLNPHNITAKATALVSQSNIDFPPSTNLAGPLLKQDDDDSDTDPEVIGRKDTFDEVGLGDVIPSPTSKPDAKRTFVRHARGGRLSKTVSEVEKDSDSLIALIETAGTAHDAYLVAAAHFRMHMNKARLLQVLNSWVKNNPKVAYPYYMRGLFEDEFNRLDRASEDFQKALALNPLCVQAMNRYAYVLFKQKRYRESVETYDMVEQLKGMYPASFGHRADALLALKDYDNAALDYGRAVRAYIGEREASRQIAAAREMSKMRQGSVRLLWARKVETLNKAKKYQRAVDEACVLLMFSPGYTRAMDARQKGYQALGKYELALKDLDGMIAISPRIAPWYKDRMEVLTKLGRTKEAEADRKRWENVLRKGVPE